MTLDEFMQQDPKAKITITERTHNQDLLARLEGTLWHDWYRGTNVNIVATGYGLKIVLANLGDHPVLVHTGDLPKNTVAQDLSEGKG